MILSSATTPKEGPAAAVNIAIDCLSPHRGTEAFTESGQRAICRHPAMPHERRAADGLGVGQSFPDGVDGIRTGLANITAPRIEGLGWHK